MAEGFLHILLYIHTQSKDFMHEYEIMTDVKKLKKLVSSNTTANIKKKMVK